MIQTMLMLASIKSATLNFLTTQIVQCSLLLQCIHLRAAWFPFNEPVCYLKSSAQTLSQ